MFWVGRPLVVQIDLKRSACCALPGFSRIGLKVEQTPDWTEKVIGEMPSDGSATECFLVRALAFAGVGTVPTIDNPPD